MNNQVIYEIYSFESNQWVECDKQEFDNTDEKNRRILSPFITEFKAVEANTGELKKYGGENIYAENFKAAQDYCNKHHPYLNVIGELA